MSVHLARPKGVAAPGDVIQWGNKCSWRLLYSTRQCCWTVLCIVACAVHTHRCLGRSLPARMGWIGYPWEAQMNRSQALDNLWLARALYDLGAVSFGDF